MKIQEASNKACINLYSMNKEVKPPKDKVKVASK